MIQQMNILPAQPTAQAAPTQQTDKSADNAATFQSMMKVSADKLEQDEHAKTEKAKPNTAQEKDSGKTISNADAQALQAQQTMQGLNANMIGNVNASLNAVVPQATGGTQQAADTNKVGAAAVNSVSAQNASAAMLLSKGAQAITPANMPAGTPNVPVNTAQLATASTAAANVAATENVATMPSAATASAATSNAPTVQPNLAVPAIAQNSQPIAQQPGQQAITPSGQTNLQGMAQTADTNANQPVSAQNATVTTPVSSQTDMQTAQAETVGILNQNSQEKLNVQASDVQVQAAQTKQTELPTTAKVVNVTDEKASANQQNNAGYAELFHSGNVVIPISDSSASLQKSVSAQLTDTITTNLHNGRQEFQVDLFPKDLGKVSVKLASENGVLTVEIMAANPKTQSMLLSGSGEIQSILQASVHQTVHVVDANQNKQAYDEQQKNSQSNAQQQQQQEENRQQNRNYHTLFDNDDDSISTVDFLSVMQQLSVNT